MTDQKGILRIFPEEMRGMWRRTAERAEHLQEIRLRAGKKILLYIDGGEWYLDRSGAPTRAEGQAVFLERRELEHLISYVCGSSMYAYEEELSRGYLTLPGGHRMGLVGEAVLGEGERVRSMKHISGVNLRIAHEVKGAADRVLPRLYENGRFLNTLIVSPPCCGKTTLLRDVVRQVSDGNPCAAGITVGVVDERSEIAGSFRGIPQNDVGMRTDVLDSCPKAAGMLLLIRSMSPRVIAVDELGEQEEIRAVRHILRCGCGILATVHAETAEEAADRLFGECPGENAFERYVVLARKDGKCVVSDVLDRTFRHVGGADGGSGVWGAWSDGDRGRSRNAGWGTALPRRASETGGYPC